MTWARIAPWSRVAEVHATPTVDERALLDAVIAAPSDDAPRLVYADWLQAQPAPRQAARGELIVVQCSAHAALDPAERDRIAARDLELVARYGTAWCGQAGLEGTHIWARWSSWEADFQRGFIEVVRVWTGAFPSIAVRMFSREPVRELELTGQAPEVVARLAGSVFLRRLRALVLREAKLSDEVTRELAMSPHAGGLVRLELYDGAIGDAGALALARSTALASLEEVVLVGGRIGADARRELEQRFPRVRLVASERS